jgi:periplasmic protein TonB
MNARALHLPAGRGLARWLAAGVAILFAHAAILAAIALWYARQPVEPNILPAIAVTLAPAQSSSPEVQNQDIAVGPTMQQSDEAPKEPPKTEEEPVEQVAQPPSPPQQAEVALPQVEEKVEHPKPEMMPPAPETRAPPKNDHIGQFTEAGSNAYNALVLGHLQRFKRYPRAARGASGTALVTFVLDRTGRVIDSTVTKSAGNRVLDEEALETLRRASPFPGFPKAKPGTRDSYIARLNFSQSD